MKDVKNMLWVGWILDGVVKELYSSKLTVEETIKRANVRALDDFLVEIKSNRYEVSQTYLGISNVQLNAVTVILNNKGTGNKPLHLIVLGAV